MAKVENANEYLELKQQTNRDVRQLGVLTSARFESTSTVGQTVINLDFTVNQSAEQIKSFQLFLDGALLREGVLNDFIFTNVSNSLSAQITLNAPIATELNIIALKVGGYSDTLPNASTVTATLLNDVNQPHKMALAGFQNFVKKEFVTAPNTTIINRAQVESGSLKAIAGVERIPFKGLSLLRDEVGSSNEQTFELNNKDSRVRFVGTWYVESATQGTELRNSTIGNYFEISFYGTGINILTRSDTILTGANLSIDGGANSTKNIPAMSAILVSRNYNPNVVFNLISGLTLGYHTVRYTLLSNTFLLDGAEILNERSTLGIVPGIGYAGMKEEVLSNLSATAFNAGVVGTKGARVVKYLKDGSISQAITEVNAASAFLTSANHTNEEVVRKINWREFGANRADDFSTLSTARAAAFTLDDGTTTLVGDSVVVSSSELIQNATSNFYTLTFIGTGLDMTLVNAPQSGGSVYIDGILVAGTGNTAWGASKDSIKICSGLPYGTHTIKFLRESLPSFLVVKDFIIYQPKKPTLPVGAVEITDYNVMANYAAGSSTDPFNISTGTLRKATSVRENIYSGTFNLGIDTSTTGVMADVGWSAGSVTSGNYHEYTFFGTGFEYHGWIDTYATTQSFTISLNGLTANTTNFSTMASSVFPVSGSYTFAPTTGIVTAASVNNLNSPYVSIRGLPLAKYTVRFTNNGAGRLIATCLDVITPIHVNTSSLKVGSLSLRDSRAFSPVVDKPEKIDLAKAKATLVYDLTNQKILYSTNISAVLKTGTGVINVYFEKPFRNRNYVMLGSNVGGQVYGLESGRFPNMCTVIFANNTGAGLDSLTNCASFFGELEDEGEI